MKHLVTHTVLAIGFALSTQVMAQADHSMHGAPMAATAAAKAAAKADASAVNAALGDGQVKKLDKAKGMVTLAHGALPNGMPPMTMAYKVKDVKWLDTLVVGQKIRFATDPADGGMTVSRIELVK